MSDAPNPLPLRPIQMLALACLALLYAGHLFDVFANPPHSAAYWGLIAVGLGVDLPKLRELLLKFLNTMASGK